MDPILENLKKFCNEKKGKSPLSYPAKIYKARRRSTYDRLNEPTKAELELAGKKEKKMG